MNVASGSISSCLIRKQQRSLGDFAFSFFFIGHFILISYLFRWGRPTFPRRSFDLLFKVHSICGLIMLSINELTCRVCLHEQQVLINVFDELEDLETSLSSLLEKCGGIQVENDDIFPKYLCEECTRELLISAKFRDKCAKSKEVYEGLLKEGNVNNNNEDDLEENESCKEQNMAYSTEEPKENNFEMTEADHEETNGDLSTLINPDNLEEPIIEEEVVDVEQFTHQSEEIIQEVEEHNDEVVNTFENPHDMVIEENTPSISYEPNTNDFEVHIDLSNSAFIKSMPIRVKKQKSYTCDICGAAFVQSINLRKHLQKTHALTQCYACTICDHWFSSEMGLLQHAKDCKEPCSDEELSSEEKGRKVQKSNLSNEHIENDRRCVYCERVFQTPFALRMHLRTHTGERPFQCQYCDKSFKTQSSLNSHVKRHIGQADFVCSICGKAFYERGNLDVHMLTHTGERPHSCTVCQKKFTRVFLLELHMRTHTGEKPYPCSFCDKSFRQRSDWKNHLTTHTGAKKHKCQFCPKSYMKRASLEQHMRTHSILQIDADNLIEQSAGVAGLSGDMDVFGDFIENEEDFQTNEVT
ncbi:zinc finger protein 182 [Musca domestica]|uniref:Zinc finger protein 182 n=1 Tax=Musca domestica TaxID=7370 RepID=A0A9J7CMA6_MUSDO|nr:zinc finger protein 182 [Musca domestica]